VPQEVATPPLLLHYNPYLFFSSKPSLVVPPNKANNNPALTKWLPTMEGHREATKNSNLRENRQRTDREQTENRQRTEREQRENRERTQREQREHRQRTNREQTENRQRTDREQTENTERTQRENREISTFECAKHVLRPVFTAYRVVLTHLNDFGDGFNVLFRKGEFVQFVRTFSFRVVVAFVVFFFLLLLVPHSDEQITRIGRGGTVSQPSKKKDPTQRCRL
jgi:cation transport ATPase